MMAGVLSDPHNKTVDKYQAESLANILHGISPDEFVVRGRAETSCSRLVFDTHQSESGASKDATLILSERSSGKLYADLSGDKTESNIKPGVLTFVPRNTPQIYDFKGQTTNTFLFINESLFDRVSDLSPELGKASTLEPRAAFIRPRLHRLVEEHYGIMSSEDAGWRILAEASALRIARELFLAFSGLDREQAGALPLSQAELSQLIDFIEAELENNFDLTDLAEVLGRNPFGFSRSFRAATGESPHQFVIQRRLSKAKELLEHTDDALAEIAYATGFSNQSHMTATFSKHLGTPPGAYRKAVRG